MSSIVFERVHVRFAREGKLFPALAGVDLSVADSEVVALVGPSGCGKTTCLRLAAGFEVPTCGRVSVGGAPVAGPGPDRAVVFQQFALFPWKNVEDNIAFGLRNKRIGKHVQRERVSGIIRLMGLEGYETAYPHQLSGGMQQRVAIARAYVLEPQALLMDEPFGALDAQTRIVMQEELVRIQRLNPRTVLFITHAVDEAVFIADRVAVMTRRPGRIKEILDVDSIRAAEHWKRYDRIEDVMDLQSFVHLRTRIWRSLREEKIGAADEAP
jgi:NitT/TauT family transport system ATP-binding protein